MSRTINSTLLAALYENANTSGNLQDIEPYFAVTLEFDGGDVNMWTGVGPKTIGAATFSGVGGLLQIDGLEETSDLGATGTTITLSGVNDELLGYALTENYQGRMCRIYWGVTSVSQVVEVFSGYMDRMTIQDAGESSTITLTVESRLITLERPVLRRYTHMSHQATIETENYSNDDSFFKWVTKLADKQIAWGRDTVDSDG